MNKGFFRDQEKAVDQALSDFERLHGLLPGLSKSTWRKTLILQIISSVRRIEFVRQLQFKAISPARLDPSSSLFDPLKGAALLGRKGDLDEAVWLTFVGTHFGKHLVDGWRLAANVMGSFGEGTPWTAQRFGADRGGFQTMLLKNGSKLKDARLSGRYSNHRQYQSKHPDTIFEVFSTFYDWQFKSGGFRPLMVSLHQKYGQDPAEGFDALYKMLNAVYGLGRLGKFDFITMLGKLELAPVEAGSVYLVGSTGPLSGARLLFCGDRNFPITAATLEPNVDLLDDYLHVGKQVIEDSLCNWQKKPEKFEYCRG